MFVFAQTDQALRLAGLSDDDIFRRELKQARNAVHEAIREGWNMVATARHTGEAMDPERLAALLIRLTKKDNNP
jgi:hypothetical protein